MKIFVEIPYKNQRPSVGNNLNDVHSNLRGIFNKHKIKGDGKNLNSNFINYLIDLNTFLFTEIDDNSSMFMILNLKTIMDDDKHFIIDAQFSFKKLDIFLEENTLKYKLKYLINERIQR